MATPQRRSTSIYNDEGLRRCCVCRVYFPLTEFHSNKGRPDGLASRCKTCGSAASRAFHAANPGKRAAAARAWYARPENRARVRENARRWQQDNPEKTREMRRAGMVKGKYGLTREAHAALLESQDGKCAICRGEPTGGRTNLCVDHDHETGAIRGLLCGFCNVMLGYARERDDVLEAARRYLEANR